MKHVGTTTEAPADIATARVHHALAQLLATWAHIDPPQTVHPAVDAAIERRAAHRAALRQAWPAMACALDDLTEAVELDTEGVTT